MEQSYLDTLHRWFEGYVRTFCDTDPEGLKNILLKVEHSRKVCEVMDAITAGEGFSASDSRIAAAVALLHDAGRFPQYRRWRTYRDSESDNHARLSVEVIREQQLLDGLLPAERLLIEESVRFHNLLAIPDRLKSPTALFLRLIRDADKLDIWRVFLDFFAKPEKDRASAALLGLPDLPTVTAVCLSALSGRNVVQLKTVACVNDFKLLLISWVFDLNFCTSYRLLQRSDYLQTLESSLPDRNDIRASIASAREYVATKATGFAS